MSSFIQFVLDHQLPIAKDVEKPWFKKVWLPLTMRQISVKDEVVRPRTQLGTPTITITSEIFDFLGYEQAPRIQQQKFRELLNRAEIPFKQIAYDDPNADETVKEDGLKLTEHNRQQKRWITMAVDDFKDALMMLNTKRAKEIRLYYRNLESAVFQFMHHSLDMERRKVEEEKDTEIRQLELNNTGLQGEITAMDREIARRDQQATELQIEVARLRQRYVDYCRDPGKDNVIMIFRKHTSKDNDKHFQYPYYIARIQRRKVSTKRRKLRKRFPRGEEIVVIDNPNSVHAFNRFEEEGHVERYQCHFKLTDLTREDLYDMGIPAIEE